MVSIWIPILSLLTAFLYSRSSVLYCFYANSPARLEQVQNLNNAEIKFPDVVSNCEDVVLDSDRGFAILSCDPGRDVWNTVMGTFVDPRAPAETGLYLWNYADTSITSAPQRLDLQNFTDTSYFHPLGIEYYAPSKTLFVINHALDECYLDIFKLSVSEKAAVHKRRVRHPLLAAPNSVYAVNEHELFVTNDHYFLARNGRILPKLETYLTISGGSVVSVDLRSSEPVVASLARVSFANGVVLLNHSSLAVASTTMSSVYIYTIISHDEGRKKHLKHATTISVPFHPDNLSIDGEGELLIAGHPHVPTVEKMIQGLPRCRQTGAENIEGCVKAASWLAEWSERDGLRSLYVGDWFGTSTTAVRDVERGVGIASGLYERGILVWTDS